MDRATRHTLVAFTATLLLAPLTALHAAAGELIVEGKMQQLRRAHLSLEHPQGIHP